MALLNLKAKAENIILYSGTPEEITLPEALENIHPEPYELPIASADTLGGIKVGDNLTIDSETGELSADFSELGSAAELNVPEQGEPAGNDEVVIGSDPRLTDSRNPNSHQHVKADITDFAHQHAAEDITDLDDYLENYIGDGNISAADVGAVPASEKGAAEGIAELNANGKVPTSQLPMGSANGIASLDENGHVPSTQLPSYVDDIVEGYYNKNDGKFYEEDTYEHEIEGETNKIYVSLDTNFTYRWSGSQFTNITQPIALGETDKTAYRGDRGKVAYDHASGVKTSATLGLWKFSSSNEGHISGTTAVTKKDITDLGIVSADNAMVKGVDYVTAGQLSGSTLGTGATVEGKDNIASREYSHAEGIYTNSSGFSSHAEGYATTASGYYSHAEGESTIASDTDSHAEGLQTSAYGQGAHAEGIYTNSFGQSSHAEGYATIASDYYSHAEGLDAIASGLASHAEGNSTTAFGNHSHAEGYKTYVSKNDSHVEGQHTTVIGEAGHAEGYATYVYMDGFAAHAEGQGTTAFRSNSHAEGCFTSAAGTESHAEGDETFAIGNASHAEGADTTAYGFSSHSEGRDNLAEGDYSHVEGYNTYAYMNSHAEGYSSSAVGKGSHAEGGFYHHSQESADYIKKGGYAKGFGSHAEGCETIAYGEASHAEGIASNSYGMGSHAEGGYFEPESEGDSYIPIMGGRAIGVSSHAEGALTTAGDIFAHAEGYKTYAGSYSHAEGDWTYADGTGHAEGNATTASGICAHAEGAQTYATNMGHAEGDQTTAIGDKSHSEGFGTSAHGEKSHAEGSNTTAYGGSSHAAGNETYAVGYASHAEGRETTAYGIASHASGTGTYAKSDNQTVIGKHNIIDTSDKYAFIIGNGSSSNKSNLFTVGWDGDVQSNEKSIIKSFEPFTCTVPVYLGGDNRNVYIQGGQGITKANISGRSADETWILQGIDGYINVGESELVHMPTIPLYCKDNGDTVTISFWVINHNVKKVISGQFTCYFIAVK